MSQKVNPVAGVALGIVVLIGVIFLGVKLMGGRGGGNGGNDGTPVIVKPDNPNDPKFTEHLPPGIAGGASPK